MKNTTGLNTESTSLDLSIVIPCFNEEENVPILHKRISAVMSHLKKSYEIIFVDDGSTDQTFQKIVMINQKDPAVKVIRFRRNFGQTAAMDAGFKYSKGEIIITMDADLQNDPEDIPRFLQKIQEGYDVVCGWRFRRHDPFMKKLFSKGANILRRFITGEQVHDSGCSFRAYRKDCFQDLDFYGELHRYIPSLLFWRGFQIGEIHVKHHARKFGYSKYRLNRIIKGFLDLLVIVFWHKYSTRPIHFFGTVGIFLTVTGLAMGTYLGFIRLVYNISIGHRPLLLLAILFIVLGVQLILMGLSAHMLIKVYHNQQNVRSYYIDQRIKQKIIK